MCICCLVATARYRAMNTVKCVLYNFYSSHQNNVNIGIHLSRVIFYLNSLNIFQVL